MTRTELEFEVQDALGFIALLQEARAEKMLGSHELNRSQFTLLFLLGHDLEKTWTVSTLAQHMEMQAPGISKIVSQLSKRGWLEVVSDEQDKRKKHITITSKGLDKRLSTLEAMQPFVATTFSNWQDNELESFLAHLEKLKTWLDEHRDPA